MSEQKNYPNPRNLKTMTYSDHVNLYVDIPTFDGYKFIRIGYPSEGDFYVPLTYVVSHHNLMTQPLPYFSLNEHGSQCFIYKKVTKILTSDAFTNVYDVELLSEVPAGSRGYIQRKDNSAYHEFMVSSAKFITVEGHGSYEFRCVPDYYCKFAVIELGKGK